MEIFGIDKNVIYSKGRPQIQVAARSLPCNWAVGGIGLPAIELAKRLGMTLAAVRYAVIRKEQIAKDRSYNLV